MNENCFVIASLRRCGSSYLGCELDSYDNIFCQNEFMLWLNKHPRDKKHYVKIENEKFSFYRALDDIGKNARYKGAKLTLQDYQHDEVDLAVDIMRKEKIKIIHVVRSFVEQMVSIKVAEETGCWQQLKNNAVPDWLGEDDGSKGKNYSYDGDNKKFILSKEDVSGFCDRVNTIDEKVSRLKEHQEYLQLRNDELSKSIIKVMHFIGIQDHENLVKSKDQELKRLINKDHSQLIENWDEVKEIFFQKEMQRSYLVKKFIE